MIIDYQMYRIVKVAEVEKLLVSMGIAGWRLVHIENDHDSPPLYMMIFEKTADEVTR